jgi:hypothetical protein
MERILCYRLALHKVLGSRSIHQISPIALQRLLDALNRREQDVYVPSFDLLNAAKMDVAQFGQPLLSHAQGRTLPTHGRSKSLNRSLFCG